MRAKINARRVTAKNATATKARKRIAVHVAATAAGGQMGTAVSEK